MDPLTAVREYAMRGELDRIEGDGEGKYRFGASDYRFNGEAETAFRSKQGNLYTLDSILFFVRNHHLKHIDYLQSARAHRVPPVTLPDRKPLLDYLLGRISSADSIEPTTSISTTRPPARGVPSDNNNTNSSIAQVATHDSSSPPPFPSHHPPSPPLDYTSMIHALERPLKDRESLLLCRHRNFHEILVSATRREEDRHRLESQQRKDGLVAKSRLLSGADLHLPSDDHHHRLGLDPAAKPKMHLKGSKVGEGVPIILVPSAFQTLITIYNVKEFLEDGVFVPTDAKVKQLKPGSAKPDCVTVQKKFSRDRVVAAYEVRDKPSALKSEDWDRVVAVFVLGKEWQFKDWPFKDHVEIFNKSEYRSASIPPYLTPILCFETGELKPELLT